MTSTRASSVVATALAIVCLAGGASGAPSAPEKETARGLVRTGNERFAAGDFAAALEAYQKADELMHAPTTAFGVGRSLAKLGRLSEARDALLRAERTPVQPGESEAFATARADAAALAQELLPQLATLRLSGRCAGRDGVVVATVDGARLPPLEGTMPFRVDPGRHHVIAESPSCVRIEKEVTLATAQELDVVLALQPSPEPPKAAPPQAAPPKAELASPKREPNAWALPLLIGGSSLAGAAAIVGVATGVSSLNIAADLERTCPDKACPADRDDDIAQGIALAHVSTASFVISGAGAALAAVGVILLTADGSSEEGTVKVSIGPGFVSIGGEL